MRKVTIHLQMRDLFIIDNSVFEDALVDETERIGFKESSKEFINEIFKLTLNGITSGHIPKKAYDGFVSYFTKLGNTGAISLMSEIFSIENPTRNDESSIVQALQNLAYKFTLTSYKSILVTNNKTIFEKLATSNKTFYVVNSKQALGIIRHKNFIKE